MKTANYSWLIQHKNKMPWQRNTFQAQAYCSAIVNCMICVNWDANCVERRANRLEIFPRDLRDTLSNTHTYICEAMKQKSAHKNVRSSQYINMNINESQWWTVSILSCGNFLFCTIFGNTNALIIILSTFQIKSPKWHIRPDWMVNAV